MNKTIIAVAALAASGALLTSESVLAKGPATLEGGSAVVLAKETKAGLDMANFPWNLEEGRTEDLTFSMTQEVADPESAETVSLDYTIMIPWIEVEKDGDDDVTFTMDTMNMTIGFPNPEGGDEPVEMTVEMLYDNMSSNFVRDGDRMTFKGTADGMSAAVDSAQLAEEGMELTYMIDGKGLDISGEAASDQDWTDIQTLDVSYDYTLDEMTLDFAITGEALDGEDMAMTAAFGQTTADAVIGKGTMSSNAVINDFEMDMTAPMPVQASASKMEVGIAMPTEPAPEPQDIAYKIGLEGLELSDNIWAMADPDNAFPREITRVMIDLQMQAMMMVSLMDPDAIAEAEMSGMPPLIPTGMKINEIAFDGLGLKIDATGEGALKGTVPEGSAYVTVLGLADFVASAQKAGMFGDQEAMMIQGMAGQLGKEGDDGELIFDIETDGPMLKVNGAPVMPLPGMQ